MFVSEPKPAEESKLKAKEPQKTGAKKKPVRAVKDTGPAKPRGKVSSNCDEKASQDTHVSDHTRSSDQPEKFKPEEIHDEIHTFVKCEII